VPLPCCERCPEVRFFALITNYVPVSLSFWSDLVLKCVQKSALAVSADFQGFLNGIWRSAEPTWPPNSSIQHPEVSSLCRKIALRYLKAYMGVARVIRFSFSVSSTTRWSPSFYSIVATGNSPP
jgi:hypothetical protein